MGPSNSAPEPTPRRRPGREARPTEDRYRDRTKGAKAACEGCGYLEGGQVARDRDWHGSAHLKRASLKGHQELKLHLIAPGAKAPGWGVGGKRENQILLHRARG